MSDLGGSHTWLRDVGGGTARAMREAQPPRRRPPDAPRGELLPNGLERVTLTDGRRGLLKLGGFWQTDVERLLYEQVLRRETHGTPELLASGDGWFVVEELNALPATLDDANAAYGRLAAVHRAHVGAAELPASLEDSPLSAPEPAAFARGVAQLAELLRRAAADADVWELGVEHLAELIAWADRAATKDWGQPTLLHGDFQRGNWLIVDGDVRIVDWELAAIGPPVLDLYYLDPDGRGAGHAPAGHAAIEVARVHSPELLRDAIVWGAIAQARARLAAYYGTGPSCRAPRAELPAAAAAALEHGMRYLRQTESE